ncbi:acyltransferase [Undibacterium sp. Dicai25W]|uniref:acyltransferase n=1 Tax=Undibacterium sp. Dicai25W TaxID=3413034 RepID=UPI003BF3AC4B
MMWRLLSNLLLRLRMFFWSTVYRGYRQQYCIAPSFRFNGAGIQFYGSGRIELGEGSYVGELCSLQATSGETIRIGAKCSISHNVRVYTSTVQADADFRKGPGPSLVGSVLIGDGVWIGANTYIGPGVTVGENAVIGANSVVTRSVPSSEIWGGVPAHLIRVKRENS